MSVVVRFGDPAGEIANFSKTAHVDLIAMATHGRTGIRQFVLGSVAEQVLRIVDKPVLLLRPREIQNSNEEDVCLEKF